MSAASQVARVEHEDACGRLVRVLDVCGVDGVCPLVHGDAHVRVSLAGVSYPEGRRRLSASMRVSRVAGGAVEYRDKVGAAAGDGRDVDGVGGGIDRDPVRVSARDAKCLQVCAAGVVVGVAGAVVEYRYGPCQAGAVVGDIHGVGVRVDRDSGRVLAGGDPTRCPATSA